MASRIIHEEENSSAGRLSTNAAMTKWQIRGDYQTATVLITCKMAVRADSSWEGLRILQVKIEWLRMIGGVCGVELPHTKAAVHEVKVSHLCK